MKEQELLRSIQNADPMYYEEAEQRVHRRKEKKMKLNIIQHIISGTAVAAALAVTGVCGWNAYTAHKELVASEQHNLPPITTDVTVPETTAAAPIAAESDANFLGGHGAFRFSATGNVFHDNDNWYFSPHYSAKKSDEATASITETDIQKYKITDGDEFLVDSVRGGIYSYTPDTGVIYSFSEDGTKTPLNTPEYHLSKNPQYQADKVITINHIMRLSDSKLYIDGYYTLRAYLDYVKNPTNPPIQEFWQIYDLSRNAESDVQSYCISDPDSIHNAKHFCDGENGVFAEVHKGDENNDRWIIGRITADQIQTVLDEDVTGFGWYVYDDCIYYGSIKKDGFYKYDIKTGETTVLMEKRDFRQPVLSGDRMYAQLTDGTTENAMQVISCKPDLTDRKVFTVNFPEGMNGDSADVFLSDVCDDTLVLVVPAKIGNDKSVYQPCYILYNMTTGKTQYLIHVSDDEPVETTATTDTPEETTTTTADSEESKNTVSVPNLVGMNFNEAMQKYGDSIELDVKDKEYSLYERDIIFEQSVPENETVPKGSKITVKVSLGVMKVQLQDMTGWDYETAKQTIMSLGLVPEPQKMYDSKIEAGRVIRTEPACPCELMPGATVKIIVSLGDNKDMTKVPDFIGKSWNDAQQLATQNNLKIVKKEMNSTSPAGTVLKQNIEAKTEVSVGSTIELSVSCGDAQFSEVSILLDVPSTAVGTFYITMYNSGVPVSQSECFNAADTMGITQVIVTGTGKKEINAVLTNEDTDKEAHIGTFMVDFDKKTYYIISADTVTAYEQVGALTTAPTNTSYTTSRTYAS